MVKDIVFKRAQEEGLEEIYKFHFSYTGDMRSMFIWQWEYGKLNPFESILIIGKHEGRVVATQGVMSIPLICDDKTILSWKNESLLIDTEFRRMGVSTSMYEYALEAYRANNYKCIWGFSRKAIPTLKKAGFYSYKRPVDWSILSLSYKASKKFIDTKSSSTAKRFILNAALFLATQYSKIVFSCQSSPRDKRHYSCRKELLANNDIECLFQRIKRDFGHLIYIQQNETFLNWRVKNSPLPIESIFAYKENSLEGYIYILRRGRILELVDFVYIDSAVGEYLMKQLHNIVVKENPQMIIYAGNKYNKLNQRVFTLLKRRGFIKKKGPNDFVLNILDAEDNSVLLDISNWYITSLWYEGN